MRLEAFKMKQGMGKRKLYAKAKATGFEEATKHI